MKLKSLLSLFVFLMVCLMVSAVSAGIPDDTYAKVTINWGGTNADWDDTDVWVDESKIVRMKPNGTTETKIGGLVTPQEDGSYGTVTLNSTEEWDYIYSNRMRVMGNVTLNIAPGGDLIGPGWIRVGERSTPGTSVINQTGGRLMLVNGGKDPTRLCMGDSQNPAIDTFGIYKISGGTLTHTAGESVSSEGAIILGDRAGNGTLQVIGTGGNIDMGKLVIGGQVSTATRAATGTLQFDLESDGVAAVKVISTFIDYWAAASTANLVVNLTEELASSGNIELVNNSGAAAVSGIFDTFNGGSGAEHACKKIGDTFYYLTYLYDSVTDTPGAGNDIALIPEPATIALLSLGLLVIRRK